MPPLHASAFAYRGMGCLVMGESGSGKSSLISEAMLRGAQLIADDRVVLKAERGALIASAPEGLAGVLELRGLGLVRVEEALTAHPLHLAITLDAAASERLPEPKTINLAGMDLPHLHLPPTPKTPVAALLLYLEAMREGRILPTDWRPGE